MALLSEEDRSPNFLQEKEEARLHVNKARKERRCEGTGKNLSPKAGV